MKDEWVRYLDSIGVTNLFRDRAEEIIAFYEALYPQQLKEIFVTEYVDKENKRQFENVWIFTDKLCCEAKRFLKEDDFDATTLKNQVKYWSLKKEKYNFQQGTSDSRLTVYFNLVSGIRGELKASGENCDYLKRIFVEYILPNVVESRRLAPSEDF